MQRMLKTSLLVTAGLATVVTVAAFGAASSLARKAVRIDPLPREDLRVLAVSKQPASVTLPLTEHTVLPGNFSLVFSRGAGHARVGRVLSVTDTAIERELVTVDAGDLRAGATARLSSWWYRGAPELGFPTDDVEVMTPLGAAPAWLIAAPKDRGKWAIHLHGRGSARQETIRGLAPFVKAGYSNLVPSYRNDGVAPVDPSGRYGLGLSEWEDAEAALEYAVGRGATEIVLMGWSMGGAIALQTLRRSRFAPLITGLVLDSPAVDWRDILATHARESQLPPPLIRVGFELIERGVVRSGFPEGGNFADLDALTWAQELNVPILLHVSSGDRVVPAGPACQLAAVRPDLVTLRRLRTAGHVRLWNEDPAGWEDTTLEWLRTKPGKPGKLSA